MDAEFWIKLADILEEDEVKGGDILRDFDAWDSLSILSILAMADSDYGIAMQAPDLAPLITVDDLAAYLTENRKK